MTLQQHLGDGGRCAEVAVDLEWRMRVQQIWQRGLGEQRHQILVRQIAFLQSRPEIDDPRARPSGVTAARSETPFQRGTRGFRQLRSSAQRDLIAGMQREELRDMSMAGIGFVVILQPFLQLAVLADGQFRQAIARLLHPRAKSCILT